MRTSAGTPRDRQPGRLFTVVYLAAPASTLLQAVRSLEQARTAAQTTMVIFQTFQVGPWMARRPHGGGHRHHVAP